jgi:hypothetical protein
MNQYEILESNMERLNKKVTKIQNKCKKYGCDFHFEEVGEVFKTIKDEVGNERTARYVVVEAEGKAVINDWKFIGSVEHTEKGNIIRTACEAEVPKRYYTTSPVCEHCKTNRVRKSTFIVLNTKTNEFKQVGRSCLCDFTHGMDVELVASYISMFDEMIQGSEPFNSDYGEPYYDPAEYLLYVAESVRKFGYQKNSPFSPDKSTSRRAFEYMLLERGDGNVGGSKYTKELLREMQDVNFDYKNPENVNLVKDALVWVNTQDESNNYMHNLVTICNMPYVNRKHFGILASLIPTYNRELAYQARKAKNAAEYEKKVIGSNWFGNVKERITIEVKSIKCLTGWEGQFGYTRLYEIVDTNNNVFTWKTSTLLAENAKIITGTVKAHNEFRGIKQTELTRCRVA